MLRSVRTSSLRHFPSFTPFRSTTAQSSIRRPFQPRRCIHHVRELPYDIEQGLGTFLSPEALRMIAIDYQQGLLTRLNEQVKGTGLESLSVTDTVISTATHQEYALAFNYASQALNNSFFLDCLQPPPAPPATNEDALGNGSLIQSIRLHFGSLEQLQSTFSAAANGMINSGWVWLVSDENGQMEVVATFGAGTLLVRSRFHMRTSELPILGEPSTSRSRGNNPVRRGSSGATPSQRGANWPPETSHPTSNPTSATSPASGQNRSAPGLFPLAPIRTLHTPNAVSQIYTPGSRPNVFSSVPLTPTAQANADAEAKVAFDDMGDILTPLLCISVHEHAWLAGGFGIWGKEEYLKRFWTVVNWQRVARAFEIANQKR